MALQGDLKSFPLPEVLRLLAGTNKSGRLEVRGDTGSGEVLLHDGGIVDGAVSMAPHAEEPSDVIFELLRLGEGAFSFEEGDQPAAQTYDVETSIAAAEALVVEWAEVEAVVPSMRAWVSLAPEIDHEQVTIDRDQWRALAAVGGGGNVRDLAGALELTDLAACRTVKALVEAQLVEVRPSHAYSTPGSEVELDSFEQYEGDDAGTYDLFVPDPATELEELSADDRQVVLEDRDDALLPEPLPGEGVAFEGEVLAGAVDGHSFDGSDAHHGDEATLHAAPELVDDGGFDAEPFDPAGLQIDAHDSHEVHAHEDERTDPYAALTPERLDAESSPLEPIPGDPDLDEERTSLLKFLSSVKP